MAKTDRWALGRHSLEDAASALVLKGLCLLCWGEEPVLDSPLGAGCVLGHFTLPLLWGSHTSSLEAPAGILLFPLRLHAGVQQDHLIPSRSGW